MSALAGLQQEFQRSVYRRDGSAQALIVDTEQLSAAERLDIYADAYRLRLLEVLADDYPALQAMAGADGFERLGRAYIEATPSQHFNVRWYGAGLASFLKQTEPALAEMAALEWAMTLVFDAADEPLVTEQVLAVLAPEAWGEMKPVLMSALQRVPLRWNVGTIRQAHDQHSPAPQAQMLDTPQNWLVWRKDLTVYYRPLDPDEAWALDTIGQGATFGELCVGLCLWHAESEVALRAAALLKRWLQDGLIREIR